MHVVVSQLFAALGQVADVIPFDVAQASDGNAGHSSSSATKLVLVAGGVNSGEASRVVFIGATTWDAVAGFGTVV
jgi:hypothetical protein